MTRVLCVAEKPSISKAVAGHLAGGNPQTRNTRDQYTKNYCFDFDFGPPWNHCSVTMTAVRGHLTTMEFTEANRDWRYPPPESLFTAPIVTVVPQDKRAIADNISQQSRYADLLIIWTDCDREGENIGKEIVDASKKGNRGMRVKRAKFSNIERSHILSAARNLVDLDDRQADAVDTRIELDLRIGYAFTRFLTNTLRPLGGPLLDMMLSYGSCQFPTLGFVVDRYFRVKNFVPEPFWSIQVTHTRENKKVRFSWDRNRLFDRLSVTVLFERCLRAKTAKVTKVQEKPTRKFKPLPLTTVELQKAATRLLRMNGQHAMKVAEELYNKGFISYPRTETDRFSKDINLQRSVQKQTQSEAWGQYAQSLLDGAFSQPRQGRHDDKAHPPIHPVTFASPSVLSHDERRLYEYVVRRFLACCSEDAKGLSTNIDLLYGDETFHAHGLVVLETNYLDVFIYEKWSDTAELPKFTQGETFEPTEAMMTEGKTSAPGYLTEADLIALMDINGIGTDATMAEHIQKIQDRQYVALTDQAGQQAQAHEDDDSDEDAVPPARGGRGRGGRGGGSSASRSGGARGRLKVFIPTKLGVALIVGFDRMEFETSLGKPFLRREMEAQMKAICEGRTTKSAVLQQNLRQYRHVFSHTQENITTLKMACREFVFS
ncbi:DNA topoisomerase [Sodiomyces alkalinus F11]|uniref:DNA topoisomerase n=1 Tax=Sodiomyces alkalinus (strain CBS 110278 / VKM F-3762 / F11) TaxID=1314773 RepID=A0A3N2PMP5_SODAK|nr:DNA topoisomerase [Sodiomyces alkalinus F11]ROT35700.1 DNA topoisomerase [Sodiomyces alkalinus F11]